MAKVIALAKTNFLQLEIALPALAVTIPFFISGPQWLTGTMVNTFLFLFISKLPLRKSIPIIVLPSIAALAHGVVFGPLTPFLFYFLPFIWLGNLLMISLFSAFKKRNYLFAVGLASIGKFVLLMSMAFLYFNLKIVPQSFITSMGLIQLTTAFSGGLLSFGILGFVKKQS